MGRNLTPEVIRLLLAAGMRARSELMMALQGWAKTSGNTQAQAAKLFGITQPLISDLVRGKISLFSHAHGLPG